MRPWPLQRSGPCAMRFFVCVLVSQILPTRANEVASRALSGISQHWFEDPRCECCKDSSGVPLSSLYKMEIHKNCFGGGGDDDIGWRLVDVLAQTHDGTLTVEPMALRRVCASHLCRGSIATFWDAVHGCAASGYWKVVALAFATAKSQCHAVDKDLQESGQWLARIRGTFHGVDTSNDAQMLNTERLAELSAAEALSANGAQIHSSQLEVKCSSVPHFDGPLGKDSLRLKKPVPPPNATCLRVTSRWPAHMEQGVAPDLQYVILHFDGCVMATNRTVLELTLSPVHVGQNITMRVPLKMGVADQPGQSLIFPLSDTLGPNRQIDMRLTGHPVHSCTKKEPICTDFASTFYTVVKDPRVVRTELVADRWLRSVFDLPVTQAGGSANTFSVNIKPWKEGSKVGFNSAELTLTGSKHLFAPESHAAISGGGPLHETACEYSLEPLEHRKSCNDARTFEVDLCHNFPCKGSRLPCGAKIEVHYPEGLAIRRSTDVLSLESRGEAYSRDCAAPHLLHSTPFRTASRVEIAWSQPVTFASAKATGAKALLKKVKDMLPSRGSDVKTFSLCHASTRGMHCPIWKEAFDDRHVEPCTGAGGDCAVWSIKLDSADLPRCGGMEVIVEEGAVMSEDDETPNRKTHGWIEASTPCPLWDQDALCMLLNGDRLRAEEDGLTWESQSVSKKRMHLQTDLDRMRVQYYAVPWSKQKFLRRLQSESYLPRCVIVPPLEKIFLPGIDEAIFNYVRMGGQLYMLGGLANIRIIEEAFNFTLHSAETGNVQVRTVPAPSEALDVGAGLPEKLPVLNQLLCVSFDNLTSTRHGRRIQANGLYSRGHVEPTLGWYGFGVAEVRVGNGFLEYLGFDWHHGSNERRMPWAQLLQRLVALNLGRWAPPPTERRLEGDQRAWTSRELQRCPDVQPPTDAKDVTCTISYKCPGSSASDCDQTIQGLTEITSRQGALLLERMQFHCLDLQLQHFSPAFPVKMADRCPSWGVIDEMMKEMKAACGFGYGPDASVLDVEVVKTNLGVESFSSEMRTSICEQSFCRGQIARMADMFTTCPGEAGIKGERARLARMLLRTVQSCTRAGGATVNVQDSFLLKGVNVLNPGEHDGLAAAVREALATQVPRRWSFWDGLFALPATLTAWLGGVPTAMATRSAHSMVTVNVRPHYPSVDVWSRIGGWADVPRMPGGQDSVAFIPEDLPGGACQGCSVRNLQVLAVHPPIGAEEVDPAGAIRIFFDSVIVVDNPNALIRIYPKALEDVCADAEENPHVYYPWDTGTGDVDVASKKRRATRMAPGVPVHAVCQVHRVSDSLVKVGDEVMQITPRHPLMRNSEIVVQISAWAVRAADLRDEERYPARWSGWTLKQPTREVYTFKTSSPSTSVAQISLAMGCMPSDCVEAQRLLSQTSETLAERMKCFIWWYRCSGDSTSPKYCQDDRLPEWCNIYAPSWTPMAAAAALDFEIDDHGEQIVEGEPLELRSSAREGRAVPPLALWALTLMAFVGSCFAAYRAAQWVMDEYLSTREFDPYLAQELKHFPVMVLLALALVPPLVSFSTAVLGPVFYHRALQLQCDHSKIGGWNSPQMGAAHELDRLQSQMLWAGNIGCGIAVCAMSFLAYATIGASRRSSLDLGQAVAVAAFITSWGSILVGAGNWVAETSPLMHDQQQSREKHFEVAVLAACGTVCFTMCFSLMLLVLAATLVTLTFTGLGDILYHYLRYTWMHWTKWYDPQSFKPIGKWYSWVMHIRDLQLIHGFKVVLDGQLRDEGFVRVDFYISNDSYNVVSTRSVPVRAFSQKNMHPFEGDNICLNITNWRSVMWIEVMYQPGSGGHAQSVAKAIWDPWTQSLLSKCFVNATLCDPNVGRDPLKGKWKLWDFQDLVDADGTPKEGHYVEQRVNLSPSNGLLSLQVTHLGPKQVLDERDDPSDQPSKELYLGDTIPSTTGVGHARRAMLEHEAPASPGHRVGMVSKVSGYWTVDKGGIGGLELEMAHEMPKRYGSKTGKHQWQELEDSEWIVAVHQQQLEDNPSNFGKALTIFTSAGHVWQTATPSALSMKHLAAPRGFQIRKLVFDSGRGNRLQSIQVKRVDGKGYEKIQWTVDEEVEHVEFFFRDGGKEAHGQKSGRSTSEGSTRHCIEECEYLIAVTQEDGGTGSHLAKSLVLYTSRGKAFRIAGRSAVDRGGHLAADEGKQVVGLKFRNDFKLAGIEVGTAKAWR